MTYTQAAASCLTIVVKVNYLLPIISPSPLFVIIHSYLIAPGAGTTHFHILQKSVSSYHFLCAN